MFTGGYGILTRGHIEQMQSLNLHCQKGCILNVFGGMYFYHNMFIVCHCPTRHLAQAFQSGDLTLQFRHQNTAARCAHHRHGVPLLSARGGVSGGGWSGVLVGVGAHLVCSACSLCFALFACLVCCLVFAFGCLCPCWVYSSFG